MKRFVIDDKMDFAAFRKYLGAQPLQLAEVTPKTGAVDPAATVISAKIPGHDKLDPQSVGMALLSLASVMPYSYDARSGSVSLVLRDAISSLKSSSHRAIVWGTDMKTGKRVEASWVFRLPTAPAAPEVPAEPPAQPAVTTARALTTAAAAPGGSPKR
jgi:hypothetical protein